MKFGTWSSCNSHSWKLVFVTHLWWSLGSTTKLHSQWMRQVEIGDSKQCQVKRKKTEYRRECIGKKFWHVSAHTFRVGISTPPPWPNSSTFSSTLRLRISDRKKNTIWSKQAAAPCDTITSNSMWNSLRFFVEWFFLLKREDVVRSITNCRKFAFFSLTLRSSHLIVWRTK